jgi:hypothetical protein
MGQCGCRQHPCDQATGSNTGKPVSQDNRYGLIAKNFVNHFALPGPLAKRMPQAPFASTTEYSHSRRGSKITGSCEVELLDV